MYSYISGQKLFDKNVILACVYVVGTQFELKFCVCVSVIVFHLVILFTVFKIKTVSSTEQKSFMIENNLTTVVS
jgi:hypothetical protein